jgi:tRNA threonylcarbamoyladenosine biosynthesis protein TsaE
MTTRRWADPGRRPGDDAGARPPTRTIRSECEADTEAAGFSLGSTLAPGDLVSLTGPLGCGKSVFVRGIARSLGIEETVTSASFVIAEEYAGRLPLTHLDLYRLSSPAELEDLGFRDMLDSGAVLAVEWGEKAGPLLPPRRIEVAFSILVTGAREIVLRRPE